MIKENNYSVSLKPIDLAFISWGLHDWGFWNTPPFGIHYYNVMVKHWDTQLRKSRAPSVWVSMNNNCRRLIKNSLLGQKRIDQQVLMIDEVHFIYM